MGRLTNPAFRCVGIALNTSKVPASERGSMLAKYAGSTSLPCVDPLIDGVHAIVDRMRKEFASPAGSGLA
ncbi:MAG TPA: DUF1611 domain-containing protein [Steroidobacteraceae bacterium]